MVPYCRPLSSYEVSIETLRAYARCVGSFACSALVPIVGMGATVMLITYYACKPVSDGCMLHLCFRWLVFVGALPVFRHAQFRLGMSACFMCCMCLGG